MHVVRVRANVILVLLDLLDGEDGVVFFGAADSLEEFVSHLGLIFESKADEAIDEPRDTKLSFGRNLPARRLVVLKIF